MNRTRFAHCVLRSVFTSCVVVLLCPGSLGATTIVDTGTPASASGPNLYAPQSLAAEFTVAGTYVVTSILGWIDVFTPGAFDVALYADGGEVPGSELYRITTMHLSATGLADWRGASALSWTITPGTYWVAFEATSFSGYFPSPAPSPLVNEALRCNAAHCPGTYSPLDSLDLGIRIVGDELGSVPVPEPASMAFLCFGVIGIALLKNRQ